MRKYDILSGLFLLVVSVAILLGSLPLQVGSFTGAAGKHDIRRRQTFLFPRQIDRVFFQNLIGALDEFIHHRGGFFAGGIGPGGQ